MDYVGKYNGEYVLFDFYRKQCINYKKQWYLNHGPGTFDEKKRYFVMYSLVHVVDFSLQVNCLDSKIVYDMLLLRYEVKARNNLNCVLGIKEIHSYS